MVVTEPGDIPGVMTGLDEAFWTHTLPYWDLRAAALALRGPLAVGAFFI